MLLDAAKLTPVAVGLGSTPGIRLTPNRMGADSSACAGRQCWRTPQLAHPGGAAIFGVSNAPPRINGFSHLAANTLIRL
jgi:hypothetical protein